MNTNSKTQYAEIVEEKTNEDQRLPVKIERFDFHNNQTKNKEIPIYLTDDKVAFLIYPDKVIANDIAIIKHQLEGILLRIKFESENNNGQETAKHNTHDNSPTN